MTRRRVGRGVFLLEIMTEEIPARMVAAAIEDLRSIVAKALTVARLGDESDEELRIEATPLGTPRRLAVMATGVPARQTDERRVVIGPPVSAAFDSAGNATRAAIGFAKAQGVAVQKLERVSTPRGECIQASRVVHGVPATEALAEALPPLIESMTFPKMMRWGNGDHRFVRPIHSILALLDEKIIPMTIAGIRSGRTTLGHRTVSTKKLTIASPSTYVAILRRQGVLVDVKERRAEIKKQLDEAARKIGGRIAPPPTTEGPAPPEGDEELLEEVLHLVEWPTVISGSFDEAFLDLPSSILVTAMRHHQKFFSLLGRDGGLLGSFLAVANVLSDRSGAICRGNEWVLRARLADARFFWEEDRRVPFIDRRRELERVTFHEKLGSYALKTARMEQLVDPLLEPFKEAGLEIDRAAAVEAIRHCKSDLTTQMVNEFPELQGMVGGIYARAEGLSERVASAIEGHYGPRGADDALPAVPEGLLVSIVDRLDTQAGLFLIGIVPTGSRDPYGLRRSAQGVCRILIESRLHVSLTRLIDCALGSQTPNAGADSVDAAGRARAALIDFYRARLQYLGEEAGLRSDSVRAALATNADDPYESRLRMNALDTIRSEPGFESLALAHKRIKNILKTPPSVALDAARLHERAERDLHADLEAARPTILEGVRRRDYLTTLRGIADLRPALDRFFDEVMVMVEDPAIRENRLALLQTIASLFTQVGDFSEIAVEGDAPAPQARG
ncbi:MAG: glycine--tRNA ligase subunit beta [Acidobacteriota bacterium]